MGSNTRVKNRLIQLYGPECFIDKLHLRKDHKRRYTSKAQMKKMRELTYHHMLEKSKGGKATVENGALLSAENHAWFHKQTPEYQRYMNQQFRKYKECEVVFVDQIETDLKVHAIEFRIDLEKDKPKIKYNRAKVKREMERRVEEYERDDDRL